MRQPAFSPSGVSGHNLRAVLAKRGFRRLVAVRVLSQIADGLFQAGLAGSVLFNPQRATSAAAVAAGFAVLLLPYSLIGPYVGVMIDRWSRRSIISATNALRAAFLLPISLLIWNGREGLPFLVLALCAIGFNRLFLAALAAATPHVVDDELLVTANAVGTTLGSTGYSLSLASVALMIPLGLPATFHGYAAVAFLGIFGYLASATMANRSFSGTELGPDEAEPGRCASRVPAARAAAAVAAGMIAGMRHLTGQSNAWYAQIAQSAHRFLYGVLALATLLLYRNSFGGAQDPGASVGGLGGMLAAGGVGMLLAALITPSVARRIGGWRWIVFLLATAAVAIAAFGLPMSQQLLPLAVGWVSVAAQGTKIVVDTTLQHECSDEFRGRVFSVNDTLFNLSFVAGTYAGVAALPSSGRSQGVLGAVICGYLALACWYWMFAGRAAGKSDRAAGEPGRTTGEPDRAGRPPGRADGLRGRAAATVGSGESAGRRASAAGRQRYQISP